MSYYSEGFIEWSGEDGSFWKDEVVNGELVRKSGKVVYE